MTHPVRPAILLLLVAAAPASADERIDRLIRDLADPDPAVREKASDELVAIGEPAREQLTEAARSPRPAIATAAAAALAKLPWDRPDDPPAISQALKLYGNSDENLRAGILLDLISQTDKIPEAPAAAVRVLKQEPSSQVAWSVALRSGPDGTDPWKRAVAQIDDKSATPPLRLILATHEFALDVPGARERMHEALAAGRDAFSDDDTSLMLTVYSFAARNDLHADAAWALERVLANAGGEAFVINRGNAQDAWPNVEMAARVKWHRFKDAESRKDDKAMTSIANELLESQSTEMSVFLDVLPTLEKSADAAKIDAYFQRAYEQQKRRMEEAPDEPVHKNDLAWLLARSGRNLAEAEPLAEAAVKAKPTEAAYLDTLAEVKFRLGKIDEAIRLEEEALKHQPGDTFMIEQLERFKAARSTTQPAPGAR